MPIARRPTSRRIPVSERLTAPRTQRLDRDPRGRTAVLVAAGIVVVAALVALALLSPGPSLPTRAQDGLTLAISVLIESMPFVVLVPDRPPPGARTVLWSRDDPRLTPQTTISYISQGARTGVTIMPAAEGATPVGDAVVERPVRHAGRQMYVVEPGAGGAGLRVRVVIDGTDARISGGDLTEERALAIAASLNPVESPAP